MCRFPGHRFSPEAALENILDVDERCEENIFGEILTTAVGKSLHTVCSWLQYFLPSFRSGALNLSS